MDINEVLALDRFRIDHNHRFNISPKHLPLKPSNLLRSDVNISDSSANIIDHDHVEDSLELDEEALDGSGPSNSTTEDISEDIGDVSQPDYSQVGLGTASEIRK